MYKESDYSLETQKKKPTTNKPKKIKKTAEKSVTLNDGKKMSPCLDKPVPRGNQRAGLDVYKPSSGHKHWEMKRTKASKMKTALPFSHIHPLSQK